MSGSATLMPFSVEAGGPAAAAGVAEGWWLWTVWGKKKLLRELSFRAFVRSLLSRLSSVLAFHCGVELDVDFTDAAMEDKLEGTVNYERVYEVVAEVMNIDAQLLEHLAGKMIRQLKSEFPQVNQVKVKVSKYNPPIKGLCHRAVVTLEG